MASALLFLLLGKHFFIAHKLCASIIVPIAVFVVFVLAACIAGISVAAATPMLLCIVVVISVAANISGAFDAAALAVVGFSLLLQSLFLLLVASLLCFAA